MRSSFVKYMSQETMKLLFKYLITVLESSDSCDEKTRNLGYIVELLQQ